VTVTTTETHTLSHFKRHAAAVIERIKASGQPIVLTVHGKAELVVQNADAYRRLRELAEKAEMYEFLKGSIADADAGRTRPMREAIEALGRTDALPR
jgi:prevent-host-death family protein